MEAVNGACQCNLPVNAICLSICLPIQSFAGRAGGQQLVRVLAGRVVLEQLGAGGREGVGERRGEDHVKCLTITLACR